MTPYLVVARLPAKTTTTTTASGDPRVGPAAETGGALPKPPPGGGLVPQPQSGGRTGPGAPGAGDKTSTTDDGAAPVAAAGTGSDTGFVAQSDTFVMKIVYLPDYSHSVAVRVRSGMFGSSSLQLSFENGMLTAVGGKVDNSKAGDVAVAALQAISTIATGGASKAGGGGAAAPGGAERIESKPDRPPLRPGVYAFVPVATENPLGICTVAYFTEDGVVAPSPSEAIGCKAKPGAAN
ncbi:hypothetical protein KZX46_06625 [Polymorphobacter sp. PAMC 29334]|uniref:hypothetical protein n=1 Tax=Polymorphobacter sp. PAMC 29334 TaxID=2862331 RepID=UPI001C78B6F4|nr:hypothetical protein [Polymorphobacter sp. PAMC 29334]QYE35644.1 hypothetical protein KZX46_06625 [Polymorphobacter sp. PAMC 29334]